MEKIISLGLITVSLVSFVSLANAQMGMMDYYEQDTEATAETESHTDSIETILQEILSSQNVSQIQDLDLSKVSDDQWEKLGDAVMESHHPGDAHEAMDEMMGGEGSESLRDIHIQMGKNYLTYGDSYGYGMMGRAYANRDLPTRSNYKTNNWDMPMSRYHAYGVSTWHTPIMAAVCFVTVTSLNLFLLSGAYFFVTKARSKNKKNKAK